MKQHRHYILVIAAIFGAQVMLATIFILSSDGSDLQKHQISLLESKNNALSAQLASMAPAGGRHVASIKSSGQRFSQLKKTDKELDMSDLYFSQIERFKKDKNTKEALDLIEKIQSTSSNPDSVARAEYEKINLICTQRLENECIAEIDTIVSQFPDSNWTARSLLLLSHFYYKQNRTKESRSLIHIIRTEFKAYNDLNRDIQKLSTKNL